MTVVAVAVKPRIDKKVSKMIGKDHLTTMVDTIDSWKTSLSTILGQDSVNFLNINDYVVTLSETAKVSIRDSLECKSCNKVATHFVIHQHHYSKKKNKHSITFFYIENDELIPLTKDHIIPRSSGGPDSMGNYECMCFNCNQEKSNSFIPEDKAKAGLVELARDEVTMDSIGMAFVYHEKINDNFFYKKRKVTLTKDESIRMYRGKIIIKDNIAFLDSTRLQQLAITEKYFFLNNQLHNNLSEVMTLPWYLKPFKGIIMKRFEEARANKKIPQYIKEHADHQQLLDGRTE